MTMTDSDYADDLVLLVSTPVRAESLLHSLEPAARGIDLYMNANKTEYMCFKQKGTIFPLRVKLLELVDLFPYLGCNISSTESDVNICLHKAWNAIGRLSIILKPYLFDKISQYFF